MKLIARINLELEALEDNRDLFQKQIDRRLEKLATILRLDLLDSVGAFIDMKTGLVHSQLANGDPELDEDQATHIADCCDEWTSTLSQRDAVTAARVQFRHRGDIA